LGKMLRGTRLQRFITLHLPDSYIEWLDELVKRGHYASRAEAIRIFIRDGLIDEMGEEILPR